MDDTLGAHLQQNDYRSNKTKPSSPLRAERYL